MSPEFSAVGAQVRVIDLGVRFDGVTVLDGVHLTFEPGRLTAVVGPSGSGKTTLFTVLAGLQPATSGRVEIDGVPLAASPVRVGLVHQAYALLSLLTAAENVELAAQLCRVPARSVRSLRADAAACLEAVGLADRADHLVEELSGGEQQRVAVARAMVIAPQVLLADEPTAQLDPHSRTVVVELLQRVAAGGTTVVLATHDTEVAAECDAVAELRSMVVTRPTEE